MKSSSLSTVFLSIFLISQSVGAVSQSPQYEKKVQVVSSATPKYAKTTSLSKRQNIRSSQRVSVRRTKSLIIHQDLLADPRLFKAVAESHGMNAVRFRARYSESQQIQMIINYLSEREMAHQKRRF